VILVTRGRHYYNYLVRLKLVLVATATTQVALLYLTPFRQDPLMDAVRCGIDFLGCTLFIPRASGGKREAVEFMELIQMFSHWRQNRRSVSQRKWPHWIYEDGSTLVRWMALPCPLPQMTSRGFFQHPTEEEGTKSRLISRLDHSGKSMANLVNLDVESRVEPDECYGFMANIKANTTSGPNLDLKRQGSRYEL
jgi:hypothetical protein